MRLMLAPVLLMMPAVANADDARFGVALDLKAYPQATPKECLASILKAVEQKRFDYLAAQLGDPAFIDDRVKRVYGGRFDQQVEDTSTRFDPAAVKLLQHLLKDGVWTTDMNSANVHLKESKTAPSVFFIKIGERLVSSRTARNPELPRRNVTMPILSLTCAATP